MTVDNVKIKIELVGMKRVKKDLALLSKLINGNWFYRLLYILGIIKFSKDKK